MLHGSTSPGTAGSELIRLLARLDGTSQAVAAPAFAERLGQWLGWSDAITLSSALDAKPAATSAASARTAAGGEEADFRRVRAALEASVAAGPREAGSTPSDFGPIRRHCIAQQHAMEHAAGALRLRLREALSRHSPALARLAAIDAVLATSLAAHERNLLGLVPLRLKARFDRLHSAAGDNDRWQETFRDDMDRVLRAELAHRLLPAQGLLDTLIAQRTR